ncbi:MAG TPA: hypothetical protein VJX67_13175 [Blastocatellia bacterium]|nr:hypothetical protein [Blastocatellia bacterium]
MNGLARGDNYASDPKAIENGIAASPASSPRLMGGRGIESRRADWRESDWRKDAYFDRVTGSDRILIQFDEN